MAQEYYGETQITQEFISNQKSDPMEYLTKNCIIRLLNDLPLEDLKRLVEVTIIDPNDKETIDKVRRNLVKRCDYQKLDQLRDAETILIQTSIWV